MPGFSSARDRKASLQRMRHILQNRLSIEFERSGRPLALVSDIYNYRPVSAHLATSGQPDEEELAAIAATGFQVIVNIALHDDPRYSLPDEAGSVRALGLEYIHIPVVFTAPTARDLEQFFDVMDRVSDRKVWVHCAANKRVSTFLGLYWHLRRGQPREQAFALMRSVWEPNEVWSAFVAERIGG